MNYSFSIIIPHKNIPDLLRKCLDSIPHRDDVQIIIVDDNSDEQLVDFQNFPGSGEKNTEVYFTKKGKGAGFARNEGLKHVKGKWILFADADDYYTSYLSEFLDNFKDDTADCIFFFLQGIDLETGQISNRCDVVNNAVLQGISGDEWCFKTRTYYSICKMIKTSYLQSLHLKYDEYMISEDMMFSLKLACNMKQYKIYSEHPIYVVTSRPHSLSKVINIKNVYTQAIVEAEFNAYLRKLGKTEYYRGECFLESLFQESKSYFLLASIHKSYYEKSMKPFADAIRVCTGFLIRTLFKKK